MLIGIGASAVVLAIDVENSLARPLRAILEFSVAKRAFASTVHKLS